MGYPMSLYHTTNSVISRSFLCEKGVKIRMSCDIPLFSILVCTSTHGPLLRREMCTYPTLQCAGLFLDTPPPWCMLGNLISRVHRRLGIPYIRWVIFLIYLIIGPCAYLQPSGSGWGFVLRSVWWVSAAVQD